MYKKPGNNNLYSNPNRFNQTNYTITQKIHSKITTVSFNETLEPTVDFIYMHGNLKLTRVFLQNHITVLFIFYGKLNLEPVGLITKTTTNPPSHPQTSFPGLLHLTSQTSSYFFCNNKVFTNTN